ncbi:hypothetical protein [Pontibacter sp. BT731]|uniref:hypothetical protein n=1 Tax=Pontibacter coccineus TaxID=3063328 RepID=UPI0026E26D06|nr:hypothetical protein [Pontibacter sp. BT731]
MSLALLWAVMLHGTAAYAHDTVQVAQRYTTGIAQGNDANSDTSKTSLQCGQLYLAQEGTNNTLSINLQPAATVSKANHIRFTGHQAIPRYASRAPGDNFFCQFFYTSNQPQAP